MCIQVNIATEWGIIVYHHKRTNRDDNFNIILPWRFTFNQNASYKSGNKNPKLTLIQGFGWVSNDVKSIPRYTISHLQCPSSDDDIVNILL